MFAPRFYPARFFPRRYFPSGTTGPWVDLAVPRFRVEDVQDGTGMLTIAHASDGTTNALWAWRFGADVEGIAPTELGSRTGNGTLAIAPSQGRYQGYVKSTKAGTSGRAVSEIVGFVVSDILGGVDDELYYRCCQWAVDEIVSLELTGLTANNTKILKLPWRAVKQIGAMGVLVTPVGEQVNPRDNTRYEIGYRVQITTFRATNQKLDESGRQDILWRRRIQHHFSEQSPASLPQVKRTQVQPGPILLPAAFQSQYDVGAFVLTFWANRTRA